MSLSPERIVKDDLRLDILCCLDGASLTIPEVSAKIGRDEIQVEKEVRMLDSAGLVEKVGAVESGQALYGTRLKRQPAWVARAVNYHRFAG